MAKGEYRLVLSADGTPMRQEISKAETELRKFSNSVGRTTREIEGHEKKTAEAIRAVDEAVKKLGGAAQLTEPQLKRVAAILGELEAKGGKIPPHLRAMADKFREASNGAAGLSKEIAAIQSEKLTELAGQAGLVGRAMATLGPLGLAAAAALALTVGAASAVSGALIASTTEAVAYSDKITYLSAASDISTEALQRFEHVARLSGGSTEQLATAANKLKLSLVNAPEKFDQLGLSASRLRDMAPEQQLQAVATALQKIENPTLRAAASMDILGAKSAAVFGILKSDISAVGAEADRLGLVLSQGTVAALDNLGDSASTLDATWTALWRQLGGAIGSAPALKGIFDDLANLVGKAAAAVRDASPVIRELADVSFASLRTALSGLAIPLGGFIDLISSIPKALLVVPGLLDKISAAMGMMSRKMISMFPGGSMALVLGDMVALADKAGMIPERTPRKLLTQGYSDAFAEGGYAGLKPPPNVRPSSKPPNVRPPARVSVSEQYANYMDDVVWTYNNDAAARSQKDAERLAGAVKVLPLYDPRVQGKFSARPPAQSRADDILVAPNLSVAKSSVSAAQALQTLANIAQLSGSKLGKGLGGIVGGAAGMASSLQGLGKAGGVLGKLSGPLSNLGMWGGVATSALAIGSSIFSLFRKKPKTPPEPPPPPKEHVDIDAGSVAGGLGTAFSGIKAGSAADIQAQSKILSLSFWQVFTEQGLVAAATSFRDVFASLRDTLVTLGGDAAAEAILGPIASIMDKMGNDQFKGAAEGAHAYSQILKEMRTKDVPLTIEQFQAFEQQLASAKAQAEAGGATTKESFALLAPFLQEIISTSAKYGFTIDENTQKLIDQAKAAGVAFPTDPLDRLIAKLDEFLSKLLGIDGKQVNIAVNTKYTKEGGGDSGLLDPTDSPRRTPGFARGSGGLIDFGAETIVALHGREAILTEREYESTRPAARLASASDSDSQTRGAGRPREIVIHNYITDFRGDVIATSLARALDDEGPAAKKLRSSIAGRGRE